MPRVFSRGGVLSVCLLLQVCLAQQPTSETDPRKPGTIRMAQRLADLAKCSDRASNPFLNEGRVAALRERLRSNPPASDLVKLRFNLGNELLAAGQNEEALQEYRWVEKTSLHQGTLVRENKVNILLNEALCHL